MILRLFSLVVGKVLEEKMSLYCLAVDIFGAFDNIVYSKALFSLASSGINPSVQCLLSSWCSKSN